MKKTLLATAIIGALGASAAAQAATVYDEDGTKVDLYGRIALGIAGGGPEYNGDGEELNNDPEFVDVFSRLGFRLSQEISRDLTAFGRLEWRFRADERRSGEAFRETRQSYLGLTSRQFGTFQAGNFDSFYNQFVSLPFDVYIDQGLEFVGNAKQSRGDSIGYYTPDLQGFTAFLQAKHYSKRGLVGVEANESNEIATQGGVRYAQGPVTIGLGFVDDVVEGGGNDEMLYGLVGSYDFTDNFSARLGYEGRENGDVIVNDAIGRGGYDSVGIGGTFTTGPWAFNIDYYNVERDDAETSRSWATGAYYNVSSNFDVFVEVADADAPRVNRDTNLGDLTDDVYWLTGARYFF
ncbi:MULTISPECIES: porin [unclassified Halomonas]|uniref:porin n=1 Tax=unclassified Halomonas TaxID=2609666 RepID=UPI0020A1DA90|nr:MULTISPECIES: porin [unclassified Halomonas]MCP1315179.1 porin [Halomonas sp. 707D7]MCP1326767.1 porin [Halomonas sp. 707D4]